MRSLPVLKKYGEVSPVVRVRVIAYLILPEKLGWREKVVELNGGESDVRGLTQGIT